MFGPVSLTFEARTNTIAQALGALGSSFTVGVDTIDLAGVPVPSEILAKRFGSSCGPRIGASRNCFFFGDTFDVVLDDGVANSGAVLIWGPDWEADEVENFDEQACAAGALQRFPLQMLLGRLFKLT